MRISKGMNNKPVFDVVGYVKVNGWIYVFVLFVLLLGLLLRLLFGFIYGVIQFNGSNFVEYVYIF